MDEEQSAATPFLLSPDGTAVILTVNEAKNPDKFNYIQTFNIHLTSTLEGFLHSLEFEGQGDEGRFAYVSHWKNPDLALEGDQVLYGTERHAEFADGIKKQITSDVYAGNEELVPFFEKAFDGSFAEITIYQPEDFNRVSGTRFFVVRDLLRNHPGYIAGAFLTHIEDSSKLADVIVWQDRASRDAFLAKVKANPDHRPWLEGRENAQIDAFFDISSGN